MNEQELIEALADMEHASWSRWQSYLFSKCERLSNGALLIPAELVKHWQHEIDTPYAQLPERHKQSDRNEVAHILPIIRDFAQHPVDEDRDRLIRNVIAFNLDWNAFDHETGEGELVAWVLRTYKRLEGYAPSSLPALLYANSLGDEASEETEETEGGHAQG